MLQSRNQMSSHKRKHEQKDYQVAIRHFKTEPKVKVLLPKIDLSDPIKIQNSARDMLNQDSQFPATIPIPRDPFSQDVPTMNSLNVYPFTVLPISVPVSSISGYEVQSPITVADDAPEDLSMKRLHQSEDDDLAVDGDDEEDRISRCEPLGSSTLNEIASKLKSKALDDSLTLPQDDTADENSSGTDVGTAPNGFIPKTSPPVNYKPERDGMWKQYLTR